MVKCNRFVYDNCLSYKPMTHLIDPCKTSKPVASMSVSSAWVIDITIKINQEHLHHKATQISKIIWTKTRDYYYTRLIESEAIISGHYSEVMVERIHRLLERKKKYVRPTHDLFCNCRTCVPSINTYCKRIMSQ